MTSSTQPTLFSGDLRPFPGFPADWSLSKWEQAETVLADVRAAFPQMLGEVDGDADIEDFWEDACRVSAVWRATGGDVEAKDSLNGAKWTVDEMARRIGPASRNEEGGDHALDTALTSQILLDHGGRAFKLGSLGGDPETDIIRWLASRHRDHGVKRAVVKLAERKNGIWSIELDSDPAVIQDRLLDAMDWTYIRAEGKRDAVLAQDALDLGYEYRLFVVDGALISGAGCVEEFTPLDRVPELGAFDPRVRKVRGHLFDGTPSEVVIEASIVARLIDFGRELASEHGGTTVIDVALDLSAGVDGTPVVVELNELPNSGLYASDPWLVTEALLSAADCGYRL